MHMLALHGDFFYIIHLCYVHKGNYFTPNTKIIICSIGWP
jgi:hypothetical protein